MDQAKVMGPSDREIEVKGEQARGVDRKKR